jgi:hypothetical protein
MDKLQEFLPSGEKGYLPYYLFVVSYGTGKYSTHIA